MLCFFMIWLIGKNGMLGKEIEALLSANNIAYIATGHEIDVTEEKIAQDFANENLRNCTVAAAENLITTKKNYIINCSAYTAVEKAETDTEAAHKLNVDAPLYLAKAAKNFGATLIHFSTDYVFGNVSAQKPFAESDQKNPLGVYGQTKSDGEDAIAATLHAHYILRTAWLYGKHGKCNFVRTMIRLMNEHDEIKVVSDQYGSPTNAHDLAAATIKIILSHKAAESDANVDTAPPLPYGIYHYTNEGACSWFDFAKEIYELGKKYGHIKNDCRILPCTTAEYGAKVARPAYSVLCKDKIKDALRLEIASWQESLEKFLQLCT